METSFAQVAGRAPKIKGRAKKGFPVWENNHIPQAHRPHFRKYLGSSPSKTRLPSCTHKTKSCLLSAQLFLELALRGSSAQQHQPPTSICMHWSCFPTSPVWPSPLGSSPMPGEPQPSLTTSPTHALHGAKLNHLPSQSRSNIYRVRYRAICRSQDMFRTSLP